MNFLVCYKLDFLMRRLPLREPVPNIPDLQIWWIPHDMAQNVTIQFFIHFGTVNQQIFAELTVFNFWMKNYIITMNSAVKWYRN
jgi:hypothetical protein